MPGKMSVDLPGRQRSGILSRGSRAQWCEKSTVFVVPNVTRSRAWGQLGEPRCKIEMGVLITRDLMGSAQKLKLSLQSRKLTGL